MSFYVRTLFNGDREVTRKIIFITSEFHNNIASYYKNKISLMHLLITMASTRKLWNLKLLRYDIKGAGRVYLS